MKKTEVLSSLLIKKISITIMEKMMNNRYGKHLYRGKIFQIWYEILYIWL